MDANLSATNATRAVYHQVVEDAREASGARWVQLTGLEAGTRQVRQVAWSSLDLPPLRAALARALAAVPDFLPHRVTFPATINPAVERIYLAGEVVSAPLVQVAEGAVPATLVEVAGALGGMRHVLAVPLRWSGRVVGALNFHTPEPASASQGRMCAAFARQVALMLENKALAAATRRQVRELRVSRARITQAEDDLRRSIAEELHGQIQSRLLVGWIRLGEAEAAWESSPGRARALVSEVRGDLAELRERDVRQVSHRLHPAAIAVGLLPALRSLADRFHPSLEVELRVPDATLAADHPTGGRIPRDVRLTAYRVVEEGLGNAVGHGRARHALVRVELVAGALDVSVRDDGQGPAGGPPGLGLTLIAARVDQHGGNWSLTGAAGQGCTLRAHLPLLPPVPSGREEEILGEVVFDPLWDEAPLSSDGTGRERQGMG